MSGSSSTWTNFFFLNIGNDGNGVLTIENHGTVSSPNVDLGVDATGVGTVNVINATFNCGNNVIVGDAGTGTLAISNGAMAVSVGGVVSVANPGPISRHCTVDGLGQFCCR